MPDWVLDAYTLTVYLESKTDEVVPKVGRVQKKGKPPKEGGA